MNLRKLFNLSAKNKGRLENGVIVVVIGVMCFYVCSQVSHKTLGQFEFMISPGGEL